MAFFTGLILVDIFGILTAVTAILYAYYKWNFQYWKRKNVPYFEPSIPFGNLENPFKATLSVGEVIAKYYNSAKSKGWKHCGIYMMVNPTYLLVDLELVKNILTKDFNYFTDRIAYVNNKYNPLSNHLVNIGGSEWRKLRVQLTPTFTSGKLKAMFHTLVDCGFALEKYIEENIKTNEPFDIKDVLGKFSTDIIGSCAFGLECNSFKDPNSPFRVYGKKVFMRDPFSSLKFQFSRNFPNLARFLRVRTIPKDISDFFIKVVADTVAYRAKNNVTRMDFLQLLIDIMNNKDGQQDVKGDGKAMTITEVAAQSFVFFLAGFETSSTSMTFTLYHLGVYPDIQEKVREEICRVLKNHNGEITYESMAELKYLKQVIDETVRIYPPVPLLGRVCVQDYKVPGEDVVLEKGTRVIIPVIAIQNDPERYKNPEVFDPDRFSDENKKTRSPYAHLPFGEGPRMCIGERFGTMQTKVGLTCILRRFKITLNERTELPLKLSKKNLLASVDNGIWLDLEKL